MASLLLPCYTRLLNWVVKRLEDIISYPEDYVLPEELAGIHKLYLKDRDNLESAIAKQYPDIHPELVHLLISKLDAQDGCLSYMDRAFLVLMR
jgi:hypothetical protein